MSDYPIGLAKRDEVATLIDIELRAGKMFSPEDLAPELPAHATPLSTYERAQREDRLLVARDATDEVVGFAFLIWVAEQVHLEEIDVAPEHGRKGIGRRLLEAACDWARERESRQVTLSTFRDVAWNAPFYARLGFQEIPDRELTPALRALREGETDDGLDPIKRIMMCRVL